MKFRGCARASVSSIFPTKTPLLIVCLVVVLQLSPSCGLKHVLDLDEETRRYFITSSFGLLHGGYIAVTYADLQVEGSGLVGFTVHQSSEESTRYTLSERTETVSCVMDPKVAIDDKSMRLLIAVNQNGSDFVPAKFIIQGVQVNYSSIARGAEIWHVANISLTSPDAESIYTIAFHICNPVVSVSAKLRITEQNPGPEYLGAGLAALPAVYSTMAGVFFLVSFAWIAVMATNFKSCRLIHWLMLALALTKALSLTFHAVDYHFISTEGTEEEGWAITYYILSITKGMLLFIVVLLIGAGFGIIKHFLSDRDKRLFMIVIPLQVLANVGMVIMEESDEGTARRTIWKSVAMIVDLLCCFAILFPVIWSIRQLKDASEANGKQVDSLRKLKLFRRFYIMVLCYIYVTRIIVFLVESTIAFRYEWVGTLFDQLATFVFFFATGVMFSPLPTSQYFRVDTEDEENIEMESLIEPPPSSGMTHRKGTNKESEV